MLVPFTSLPNSARVWIYQSSREFSVDEKQQLHTILDEFLTQWTAHGAHLHAGYDLPYNRFIILGLDEAEQNATGCSIDASVGLIQQLEQKFGIDLLDKMNVTFRQKDSLEYMPLKDFRKLAKTKAITSQTIVFNNLVVNKGEYESHWEVPAAQSWHARFIKK